MHRAVHLEQARERRQFEDMGDVILARHQIDGAAGFAHRAQCGDQAGEAARVEHVEIAEVDDVVLPAFGGKLFEALFHPDGRLIVELLTDVDDADVAGTSGIG